MAAQAAVEKESQGLNEKIDALQVEVNHLTRRAESQARDLKRVMQQGGGGSGGGGGAGETPRTASTAGGSMPTATPSQAAAQASVKQEQGASSPNVELERALRRKTEECEVWMLYFKCIEKAMLHPTFVRDIDGVSSTQY